MRLALCHRLGAFNLYYGGFSATSRLCESVSLCPPAYLRFASSAHSKKTHPGTKSAAKKELGLRDRTRQQPDHTLQKSKTRPAPEDFYETKPIAPKISLDQTRPYPNQGLTSTRPAPLNAPDPPSADEFTGSIPIKVRAKYFYRLGRAYLLFYKTGFKNIWSNFKEYRQINARLNGHDVFTVVKFSGRQLPNGNTVKLPTISRREYHLYMRTRHDLRKLAPFGLIFLVFGEFTPLVILALGSMVVPYTCRIPKQTEKDRQKALLRESRYESEVKKLGKHPNDTKSGSLLWSPQLENDWKYQTLLAYRLGISPISKPIPVLGPLWWHIWVRRRLKLWGEACLCDTILIRREGGFARLDPVDIMEWSFHLHNQEFLKAMRQPGKDDIAKFSYSIEHLGLKSALEAQADRILDYDWPRLNPSRHHYPVMLNHF